MSFHCPPIRQNELDPQVLLDANDRFFALARDPEHAAYIVKALAAYDAAEKSVPLTPTNPSL